ncbi:MAG TPA: four helix bundle protein [Thermomicrobiales bacterium]|nr:four helix bundle protein [Thermomicrobiales bacterium]
MTRERHYRDLIVWQKGVELVREVYLLTSGWPSNERYGLTNQARRAAVSIPANIAEGQGRLGRAELRRALSIAHGSLCELETHLEVAQRLDFSRDDSIELLLKQADEVGRLLRAFIVSLDRPAENSAV